MRCLPRGTSWVLERPTGTVLVLDLKSCRALFRPPRDPRLSDAVAATSPAAALGCPSVSTWGRGTPLSRLRAVSACSRWFVLCVLVRLVTRVGGDRQNLFPHGPRRTQGLSPHLARRRCSVVRGALPLRCHCVSLSDSWCQNNGWPHSGSSLAALTLGCWLGLEPAWGKEASLLTCGWDPSPWPLSVAWASSQRGGW